MKAYGLHMKINKTRFIKVAAKKQHQTCREDYILRYLKNKQYKILEVNNVMRVKKKENSSPTSEKFEVNKIPRKLEKERLPIYMLTFSTDLNISRIYEINVYVG